MSYYTLIIKWMEKPPIYYFQNCRSINWFAGRESDRRRLISPLKQKQIYVFFFKETAKVYLLQKLIRRKRKQQSAGPVCVRPGTAGLVIDIECSRVRDSSWMYLTSFITTQIGVGLAAVQRKLPDCVVVGFQLNSARTFHVTISPGYIRAGRDPLQTIIINT